MRPRTRIVAASLGLLMPLCAGGTPVAGEEPPAREEAGRILEATGVTGGFIVHLGCGDGRLTAALRASDSYQVHGLARDRQSLARAREEIASRGVYGPVAADRWTGSTLPYIDNLVDLLVAEDLGAVPMEEVLRVLAPRGVAYVRRDGRWETKVKPRPGAIDEWTHYLHGPRGNAVAHDTVVGPPRHLQWLGSPRWSRHHDRMASLSAMVTEGGRLFYILDEGSRVSIQLPPKWTLVARDAFNGTVLWKRRIDTWHSHLWPLKSGPTQLARRLVAVDGEVYVTLGLRAPVVALDARTGATLRTYAESEPAEEVIVEGGQLFVLVNPGPSELTDYRPKHNLGDQGRVAREFVWNENPREIVAFDAAEGTVEWRTESVVAPLTLAAGGDRVYFHDGEKVVALDRASGERAWTSEPASRRRKVPMNFGPRLVVWKDVVLYAGGDRKMRGLSAATGDELWAAGHDRSGYQSPEDLLVVGGLVWSAPTTGSRDSGVFTGRDPRTGEVKSRFPPDVETYWFHHRCYIAKATDRYLLPSRTGIEFVDYEKEHWDTHHWVRGGCLYGILPANGLVYAPPHDCACYPEAKLFGMNALAPARPSSPATGDTDSAPRRQPGPALGEPVAPEASVGDWPMYRHDRERSGFSRKPVPAGLEVAWKREIGGRPSAPVIAGGRVFASAVDRHVLHALDASSGDTLWTFRAGGRIDSPPTVADGRCIFGSADGSIYCLRASDGRLVWRYRAAPRDRRLMAFEQLESVWPVPGSVLVEDGEVYAVAGRSNFLDGGLHFLRLAAATGEKLAESVIDERDPATGGNLQERLQVLNMPVGLPDVLSSDGEWIYMRSQRLDRDGQRRDLGPVSGRPAVQGAAQRGEGVHLFAPMGFLDGTWFHRSYWVYGRNFAGGHAGYYQAGKYAPSGRLLVVDDENVYGFGRKPQYYRWTTVLEHHLFATSKEPPQVVDPAAIRRGKTYAVVNFEKSPELDPTGEAVTVEAWVRAEKPGGVVLARGGPARGYALYLRAGRPEFAVREAGEVVSVAGENTITDRWVHLAGALTGDGRIHLWVDGKRVGSKEGPGLISSDPVQSLQIGADEGGSVGEYRAPYPFNGTIDEVCVYHGTLTGEAIEGRFRKPGSGPAGAAEPVLVCSFDAEDGRDASGKGHHGEVTGTETVEGKAGKALRFRGTALRGSGSHLEYHWTKELPIFVQAMVLADDTLFVAGPPDLIDEEATFEGLSGGDEEVLARLERQDAALEGAQGASLQAFRAEDGELLSEIDLPALPVWDGLAAAQGKLFLSTKDGVLTCLTGR